MRKITAGFKCDPQLKAELITEANESGLTLSEYLEYLCENRNSDNHQTIPIEGYDNSEELKNLRERLYEYEEVLLGDLFEQHQNTTVTVKLPNKPDVKRYVGEPQDLVKIFLESIKP